MAKAGQLIVDLIAETQRFRADMEQASRTAAEHSGRISRAVEGIRGGFEVAEKAAAAFGIALGAREVVEFVNRTLEAGAQLKTMAAQIGLTTDQYQTLRYAATQVGISQEEMNTAVAHLTRTVGEAAAGNDVAVKTFQELGVAIFDANGQIRPTASIYRDVAEALSKIADPAARARIEVALFGRTGQQLDPQLREGAGGIDELTKRAQELGVVLGKDQIEALDRAKNKVDELTLRWQVFSEELLAKVAPALIDVMDLMEQIPNAVTVHSTAGAIAAHELDGVNRSIEQTKQQIAQLEAASSQNSWSRILMPWRDWDAEIQAAKKHLADLEAQARGLSAVAGHVAGGPGAGPQTQAQPPGRPLISVPAPDTFGGAAAGAQAQISAAQRIIEQLKFEEEQLRRTAAEQKIYNDLHEAAVTAASKEGQQIIALNQQIQREKELQKELDDEQAKHNEMVAEAKRIHEEVLTPLEKYQEEIAQINELLKAGVLSQDDYNRKVVELNRQYSETLPKLDEFNQKAQETGLTISDIGNDFLNAAQGARTWQDVATAALNTVARSLLKLMDQIDKGGSGGGGLMGLLNSLLGIGGSALGGISSSQLALVSSQASVDVATLPMFAFGGGFDVGGAGGVDSQVVAFRASPWEHVEVTNPGDRGGRGGQPMVFSPRYYISTPDADSFRRTQRQTLADGYGHMQRLARRNGASA